MAGISFGSPSRYAPTSGVRATSASVINPMDAAKRQQDQALAQWKQNDALNQQQQLASYNAGYQAQNYGVDVTAKGQGPTGPWQVSAPGSSPVDRMSSTQNRGMTSTNRGMTGTRREAEDLTMSDYRTAYNEQPKIPPRVPKVQMADRTAAEQAAYGRARDAAGSEMRAGADSLADEMSARGLAGGGLEGALLSNIITKGQGQLGEVNRELAIDRMQRSDAVDDQNYQGEISQRSQDIGAGQARASNAQRLAELLRRTKVVSN